MAWRCCTLHVWPHKETCKMHLFAHTWLFDNHMLVQNLLEGHYPAKSELCTSTCAQSDVLLTHPWHSDCGSVLTQLLSNWTSQKHHYPLRSESSSSNTFSCLGLWSRMGFFSVPVRCVCRRLRTNDLLCFLPSFFSAFIFVCVLFVFFYYIISNATFFLPCIYSFLCSLKEIYVQEQLWKNVGCSGWVWYPFVVWC